MAKFVFVISEYSIDDNNISSFCDAHSNNYYYLGQIFNPKKNAVGLPEQEEILKELYGKPRFNLRKSPVKCVQTSPLDDILELYLDKIANVCQDDINYIAMVSPYQCQSSYKVWEKIIGKGSLFVNITYNNLFYLYLHYINGKDGIWTQKSIHPYDLLNFFVYTEHFREFYNTIIKYSKKTNVNIRDNDTNYRGEITYLSLGEPDIGLIINLDEIMEFFKGTKWGAFFE